jgi:hypothetical protein
MMEYLICFLFLETACLLIVVFLFGLKLYKVLLDIHEVSLGIRENTRTPL